MGPQALFGEEPRVNLLRPIEDADAVFPEKHKADLAVLSLPPTLAARGNSHSFRNGSTRPEEGALRGAATRCTGAVEGSCTPGISAENSFPAATDYYHGLLGVAKPSVKDARGSR